MIGEYIGHFEVTAKLGAGGMGEVYRATDTKLHREVALKILPASFAQDPQRMGRFQREAQVLASLNHPNIAQIYGIEEGPRPQGTKCLVMELVEGEDLSERIARGAVPLEEALPIALQIAKALEDAHEKGIVHRDLKPANIKLTPQGQVKVLDFGLAKALEEPVPGRESRVVGLSQSPTLSMAATQAGIILGTAAYMSPEQARGKPVDKRADIWSFGVVLFEMLTGVHAFNGEDLSLILASIMKEEPVWKKLSPDVPRPIRELLERCLRKDPILRLRDIGDARILIDEFLHRPQELSNGAAPTLSSRTPVYLWRQYALWAVVGLIVGVFLFSKWATWDRSPADTTVKRFNVSPPAPNQLSLLGNSVAISDDGTFFVHVNETSEGSQIYLRRLDSLESTPIPGTEGVEGAHPLLLPDGNSVVFYSSGRLQSVPLEGGSPRTICQTSPWYGGTLLKNTIVFCAATETGKGIFRVPSSGGEPELLAAPIPAEGDRDFSGPEVLPGGEVILFSVWRGSMVYEIRALSLPDRQQTVVLEGGKDPRFVSSLGLLLYASPGSESLHGDAASFPEMLVAVRFDPEELEVMGGSVPALDSVRSTRTVPPHYAFSQNGTLVYVPGGGEAPRSRLLQVDRSGRSDLLEERDGEFQSPRFSPDGERVAVTFRGPRDHSSVWVLELSQMILRRVTDELGRFQVWSPDGERIAFHGHREKESLLVIDADGTSKTALELLAEADTQVLSSWSRNGDIAYTRLGAGQDVWVLVGEDQALSFIESSAQEGQAAFSPDGHWLAFTSDRSGQDEVYIVSYPGGDGGGQVSAGGGNQPRWSRDGNELLYRKGEQLFAVELQTQPYFKADRPKLLFSAPTSFQERYDYFPPDYDVSPDGQTFVIAETDWPERNDQVYLVLNWFEELKHLVPNE